MIFLASSTANPSWSRDLNIVYPDKEYAQTLREYVNGLLGKKLSEKFIVSEDEAPDKKIIFGTGVEVANEGLCIPETSNCTLRKLVEWPEEEWSHIIAEVPEFKDKPRAYFGVAGCHLFEGKYEDGIFILFGIDEQHIITESKLFGIYYPVENFAERDITPHIYNFGTEDYYRAVRERIQEKDLSFQEARALLLEGGMIEERREKENGAENVIFKKPGYSDHSIEVRAFGPVDFPTLHLRITKDGDSIRAMAYSKRGTRWEEDVFFDE